MPKNLVVSMPDHVPFDDACFATLGAIALHGVRLAGLQLGETAAVIGLGLIGQLTVQLLRAAGMTVVGMDLKPERVALARTLGADDGVTTAEELEAAVGALTSGRGADAVLICADTPSSAPISLAAHVARDRGAVVAVGAVGLKLPRKPFFDKELEFRVSRSYGPGRYDHHYEEAGHDYPYGFVRWTEQRNLGAVIRLIAEGRLVIAPLVSHRFEIEDATKAFDLVTGKSAESFLGVLLHYPPEPDRRSRIDVRAPAAAGTSKVPVKLGVIGAGLFANATLLPILKSLPGLELRSICASAGLSAASAARRYGFAIAGTNADDVLRDPAVSTVAILTRHSTHARLVSRALEAGKHVFVEKPLCVTDEELAVLVDVRRRTAPDGHGPALMVGFNRRFAPFVVESAAALARVREPLVLSYRVNAGFLPATHWIQNPGESGRLIGEACHFIDLLIHLNRQAVRRVTTRVLPDGGRYARDNFAVALDFADGSIGTVTYVANGAVGAGKELIEVFGGGVSVRIEDFRMLTTHDARGSRRRRAWLRQDKGHRAEWQAFLAFLAGDRDDPMPFDGLVHSMRVTLAAARSLETGEPVALAE